jgi:hypothetical protein
VQNVELNKYLWHGRCKESGDRAIGVIGHGTSSSGECLGNGECLVKAFTILLWASSKVFM